MVPAPVRTALDEELTDHGRALAKALLGDVDLRPRRLPAGHTVTRFSFEPIPSPGVPRPVPSGLLARTSVLPHLDREDEFHDINELWRRNDPDARARAAAFEWVVVVVVAFAVAFLIKTFALQTFEIPSESMRPTLEINDRVVVNKLAYAIGSGVERGDVIVFDRPMEARTDDPNEPDELIKRVIGVPGDTVEAHRGLIYVNSKPIRESAYLGPTVLSHSFPSPINVPKGTVFVMGDNRDHSFDSRFFGPIPASTIVGRAMYIVWPFGRASGL